MSIRKKKNTLLCKTLLHFSNTEGRQRGINCIGLLLSFKIKVYKAVSFFFVQFIITLILFG